jgi:hypothetical protein
MARQGCRLDGDTIEQTIYLLRSTEMTAGEIALRMSMSNSTVIAINRRFHVRDYNGRRTRWLAGRDTASAHSSAKKKSA